MTDLVVEQGKRVKFKHGEDELLGTVNGHPYLFWEDGTLAPYVPVHIHAENANVIVHGANILEVTA
jgi:hypothetical protein